MPKTIKVKFRKHFKVEVPCKDVVSFENELNNKKLDFYLNCKDGSSRCSSVSYYLSEKDKPIVSTFLQENGIRVNSETLQFVNSDDQINFMSLYFKLIGVFIILLVLLQVIGAMVKP